MNPVLAFFGIGLALGYAIGFCRGWMRGVEETRTFVDVPRPRRQQPPVVTVVDEDLVEAKGPRL